MHGVPGPVPVTVNMCTPKGAESPTVTVRSAVLFAVETDSRDNTPVTPEGSPETPSANSAEVPMTVFNPKRTV